jgi:hypothetical protein
VEKNTPLPPEPPVFFTEVQVKRFALLMRGEELVVIFMHLLNCADYIIAVADCEPPQIWKVDKWTPL